MENGVNQKRNCYGFSFLLLSFQVICVVEFFDDMKMKFFKYFHLDRIKMMFLFIGLTIIVFIERSRKKTKKNALDIFDWLTYLYLAFVIIKTKFFFADFSSVVNCIYRIASSSYTFDFYWNGKCNIYRQFNRQEEHHIWNQNIFLFKHKNTVKKVL